jgi:hypothetical protein
MELVCVVLLIQWLSKRNERIEKDKKEESLKPKLRLVK